MLCTKFAIESDRSIRSIFRDSSVDLEIAAELLERVGVRWNEVLGIMFTFCLASGIAKRRKRGTDSEDQTHCAGNPARR